MSYLILVRHGESEWNAEGLWTGWHDASLDEKGKEQARKAGEAIKDIPIVITFVSALLRAQETLDIIKRTLDLSNTPTFTSEALNERDYGSLTGKNKWDIEKEFGEEQFLKWRRGWDNPPPHGESLEDVYERVIPYYEEYILPFLKEGKNVLVSAHGNSLRSLIKYLEHLSDEAVEHIEVATGEVYVYQLDQAGKVLHKEIRAAHGNTV